jgi:hypothetical protein
MAAADPFEFDKMRYKFHSGHFDCNWKVARSVPEPYRVQAHPQLMATAASAPGAGVGLHGGDGYGHEVEEGGSAATTVHRAAKGDDARLTIRQMQEEFWRRSAPAPPNAGQRGGRSTAAKGTPAHGADG